MKKRNRMGVRKWLLNDKERKQAVAITKKKRSSHTILSFISHFIHKFAKAGVLILRVISEINRKKKKKS